MLFENIKQKLMDNNINLSYQRLKIIEYLIENPYHPTVEQIFTELHKEIPNLSKTTVYNTLRLLSEISLVRTVSIDDNQTRYDINVKNHGHFKCESCGNIYDFNIDINNENVYDLKGFKIREKKVYFMGTCRTCL
jgi:Fur family peroxide stress response transcriptional regulator